MVTAIDLLVAMAAAVAVNAKSLPGGCHHRWPRKRWQIKAIFF
jgi:hypothetical protein